MPSQGQPLYALNIAASRVGLSPRTLRIYEEAGLIAPHRSGGKSQRLYSDQDLRWLRCIRDMIHEEQLTVAAIRRLLDLIPCWEVRHCPPEQALACAPHLNIPGMANHSRPGVPSSQGGDPAAPAHACPILVKVIYGVEEFGAVLPCSRCVHAERTVRKVAERHPDEVSVVKVDMMSEEASEFGAILPPTIVVNGEIIASGQGVSEQKLEQAIERHLSRRN